MELALREGLRLVVDCSFIAACSAREVRVADSYREPAATCPMVCHPPRALVKSWSVAACRCAAWQSSCSSVWQSTAVLSGPRP